MKDKDFDINKALEQEDDTEELQDFNDSLNFAIKAFETRGFKEEISTWCYEEFHQRLHQL